MNWIETYDATFFITITTIITGFLGLTIRFCLKSKCEDISVCFGLLNIKRRVDLETDIEMNNDNVNVNNEKKSDLDNITL